MKILFIAVTLSLAVSFGLCSDGDRSPFYQKCVRRCSIANCTDDGEHYTIESNTQQELWCKLLFWNCLDECSYQCMWKTVDVFKDRNYEIPKFHGKWPFQRWYGVQEPAAAFASVLNLLAHVYMHAELTQQFSSKRVPLVFFWHVFTGVCINAWVWSTIFHTRDTPFTEFMDYANALLMVMTLLVASIVRVFHKKRRVIAFVVFLLFLYYISHVQYLYTGMIDYEFNILVNVAFGTAGSIIWTFWSMVQYLSGRRYVWRMFAFTLLSGTALTLELLDFPPKYNAWDAHALWHLSTAPLPLLFYRFVIEDLKQLQADGLPHIKSDLKST